MSLREEAEQPDSKKETEMTEEEQERQALGRIVFALREYSHEGELDVARWEHNYRRLSSRHRALLHKQPVKFAAARRCVHQNTLFIKALLAAFDEENSEEGVPERYLGANTAANDLAEKQGRCSPIDVDKVRYVLKNLARDWSVEGAMERAQSYGRIAEELKLRFRDWPEEKPPRVLLPGAGLARLCVEVAAAGFAAQGNEFSYYMLLTASYLLNHTVCTDQWMIHPWLHCNINNVRDGDQLRGVLIPDVHPASLVQPGMLSMCAGDFVDVYRQPEMAGSFDAVVTCFFLDTAHNILEYLEVIHHVLKPGGIWVHLGPLLWHWADGNWDELSVEVSLQDVLEVANLMGFKSLQQQFVDAAYIANQISMYKTVYQAAFWTMEKTAKTLPEDLGELVKDLALRQQQQQQLQKALDQQGQQAEDACANSQGQQQGHRVHGREGPGGASPQQQQQQQEQGQQTRQEQEEQQQKEDKWRL